SADAAGGGIGDEDDVRQTGFLDLGHGNRGAGHLHQREDAFLHARTAGSRNDDQRRTITDREPRSLQERLADGDTHRAAEEGEIEDGDDRPMTADPSRRHQHSILVAGLALRLLQAIGVALGVAELERVDRNRRQLGQVVLALVEQHAEPALGVETHVVPAVRADVQLLLQLAMEDHLRAARALMPQIVRGLPPDELLQLGPNEIGQPAHARALRTPPERSRTSESTLSTISSGSGFSCSRQSAIRCTSAEPTTAASATRATSAACSGVLMPKPTASGRSVCRRSRSTAAATASADAEVVPVMPVIAT